MANTALLATASGEYVITLLNGPEKGASFKIVSGRVTIGRGVENDIALTYDSKVSRTHALITVTPQGVEISDVSDKNKILVDGDDTPKQYLKSNSVIQLGETKLQFKVTKSGGALANFSPRNAVDSMRSATTGLYQETSMRRRNSTSSISSTQVVMVLLALAGLYWYTNRPGPAPAPQAEIRMEEQINRDITSVEAEIATIRADRDRRGENAPNFNEINSHFIRGLRDYNKGNYQRAVESFQACLSLNPNHPQCQQHYSLASRAFWKMVDGEMIRGLKFKEQNQFASCRSAFQNVKNLVTDPTNKKYVEAEVNRKLCDERDKERF